MASIVELVRTPAILRDCVWYRVGCWQCGEYEICLSPGETRPTRCRFCRAQLEMLATCPGRTARLLPDVSKPRTAVPVLGVKFQKRKGRNGGRPRRVEEDDHEPSSR